MRERAGKRAPAPTTVLHAIAAVAVVVVAATRPAATPPSTAHAAPAARTIVVGSKNFTESPLLGELLALTIEAHTDLAVEHRANLGGTLVCWNALVAGEVDVYPEYTGTAWSVLAKRAGEPSSALEAFARVQSWSRAERDVEWLAPFGFENAYALAMTEERAAELGVRTISDLAAVAGDLRAAFSVEYLNREDGWPGLRAAYGLDFADVRGMEHALAYEALRAGEVDVLDAYTTDAKLIRYRLRTLEDDAGFFPPYDAAAVVNGATLRAHPELRAAIERLAFAIDAPAMTAMNHAVEVEGRDFRAVAAGFLAERGVLDRAEVARADAGLRGVGLRGSDLARLVLEHLYLTLVSVALASALAIPLGVWITRRPAAERVALGVASTVQTIPSLALLAFLIVVPGLGLSTRSAIVALTLYAVLPILRNTHTGLTDVAPELIDAARGMGLSERQVLRHVRLPLAARTILAGVRTATVISIGVATLAAFIGAGGLGEPIVTGLYLNDVGLILSGAVPAALLALAVDKGLGALERRIAGVPCRN